MLDNLKNKNIILGSGSPRRADLLREMGLEFDIEIKQTDESFSEKLTPKELAEYLAHKKGEAFKKNLKEGDIVITADTIVSLKGQILNKPTDKNEAQTMLRILSNKLHEVITGVSILSNNKQTIFHAVTNVTFSRFSEKEIDYYIDKFKPFDKAGAYGIQEWIGLVGVKKIEGSYYNVVGLPTHALYHHLSTL